MYRVLFFSLLSQRSIKVKKKIMPDLRLEELMKWHPSDVARTRISVIRVNFGKILIKGKEI